MARALTRGPAQRSERLLRWLLGIGLALFAAHVAVRLSWRGQRALPEQLRELLYMDSELSVCTWLSVSLLFAVGVASAVQAARARSRAWWGAAALFTYLSLDDHTMLHERIGWIWEGRFGSGIVYGWLAALGPVLAVVGGLCFTGMWRSLAGDRRLQFRLAAGFALMAFALACEALEMRWVSSPATLRGYSLEQYSIPLEELAELAAPALVLSVVGTLLERGAIAGAGAGEPRVSPRAEPAGPAGPAAGERRAA